MPTTLKNKKYQEPLERFIGSDAAINKLAKQAISNFIVAEWHEAALPTADSEDRGMLYLYPIDDGQFCMQLAFLQYAEQAGAAAAVCSLRFLPGFFQQYPPETLMANQPFRFDQVSELSFPICAKTRVLLNELAQSSSTATTPFISSLQQSETAMRLLRCALECITVPFTACQVPACRFLAHESEREKIVDARQILDNNIDRPLTIRELSRKVAINECYLKKGFKMLTGKTIHEYQQELRINKAKELLQQHRHSVTDVANILGFSSISHFSTAFKRVTGMKPCELLA